MLVHSYLITLSSYIQCTYHYPNTFTWNLNLLLIFYGTFLYIYTFYESAKLQNGQYYIKLSVLYLWIALYLFSFLLLFIYSNNKCNFITTTCFYNHISNKFTINGTLYNHIYHSNNQIIYYSLSNFDIYRYYIYNMIECWLYSYPTYIIIAEYQQYLYIVITLYWYILYNFVQNMVFNINNTILILSFNILLHSIIIVYINIKHEYNIFYHVYHDMQLHISSIHLLFTSFKNNQTNILFTFTFLLYSQSIRIIQIEKRSNFLLYMYTFNIYAISSNFFFVHVFIISNLILYKLFTV